MHTTTIRDVCRNNQFARITDRIKTLIRHLHFTILDKSITKTVNKEI